jgi:putative endonuclease
MKEKSTVKRRRAFRLGILAEYIAAALLLTKGYRILTLRYRTKSGEIDIVARKKDLIAFVEVKARRSKADAINAVGYETQRRIRAASELWLSKRSDFAQLSWRYDIVAVMPWQRPVHLPDAF